MKGWNDRSGSSKTGTGGDGRAKRTKVETEKKRGESKVINGGTMKWGERMKTRWWEVDDRMITRWGEFNLGKGQVS